MIPLCDPRQDYLELQTEIDQAMQEVADSGRYILGPQVSDVANALAADFGCQYGVGLGSGTDALYLALRALCIGPRDEVITSPFTFVATSETVVMAGAKPVFVDIDPETFNLDPEKLEAAITPRTRAIIPVHLFGQPCDMGPILDIAQRHKLRVIEDCAQATGAKWQGKPVGSLGDVGCFSFFPSKNLGAMGDGGLITTNDGELKDRVEMLRNHGGAVRYYHDELGINSRLDEMQAAILGVKRPHLPRWNQLRQEHAYYYNQRFAGCDAIQCPHELFGDQKAVPLPDGESNQMLDCVYHQYTLRVQNRDTVLAALQKQQVGSAIYYPVPLHLQKLHRDLGYTPGDMPEAESVASNCLSLPMFPGLTQSQQDQAADAVLEAVHAAGDASRAA